MFWACSGCLASPSDDGVEESVGENVLSLSHEEREWYQKFQNGILLFDGWKQISTDIIESFPDHDHAEIRKTLSLLGEKIGIEWCRDNAIRRIDTDMLRMWGKALKEAVSRGVTHVLETIGKVDKEVDALLMEKLTSTEKRENKLVVD